MGAATATTKSNMKTRIKAHPIVQTRAQMEALIGEIAKLQLERNGITAALDQEVTQIRKRFEGTLDTLQREIEIKTQLAQVWADTHPEEFGEKKSIEFVHAVVGFRTGNPTVKPIKKSFTVAAIVALLRKVTWGAKYIRQPDPVLNKEAILLDRETLTEQQLKSVGIKITQDESFYIDLKATETTTRIDQPQTEAA
jgi:phage host-nuclease inhibitor protein Gam